MSDFSVWGEGVPNWIGAVGGLATMVIAVAGFVQSYRNKGGLKVLSGVVTRQQGRTMSAEVHAPTAEVQVDAPAPSVEAQSPRLGVVWQSQQISKNLYWVINIGDAVAHVLDYGPAEGDFIVRKQTPTPSDIAPSQPIHLMWHKAWQTPSAMNLRVVWMEDDDPLEHEAFLPIV